MNKKKEILEIISPDLPFDLDEKRFQRVDDEGNIYGEPYSYNDMILNLEAMSAVNEDLMGPAE